MGTGKWILFVAGLAGIVYFISRPWPGTEPGSR